MKRVLSLIVASFFFISLISISSEFAIANDRKNLKRLLGIGAGVILLNEARKRAEKKRKRAKKRARQVRKPVTRQQTTAARKTVDRKRGAAIQRSLNALGYDVGDVDGIVGSGTRSQISAWQSSVGVAATGVLTAAQFRQLNSEAGISTSGFTQNAQTRTGVRKALELSQDDVRVLQRSLNILGYNAGTVDGKLGRGTARATKRFLEDRGRDPETTSPADAVVLAAEVAGINYAGIGSAETGGGQFAVAKPRSGEVSVFDSAVESFSSEDFEKDFTESSRRDGGGLEVFDTFDVEKKAIALENRGMRDLISMMIAANPGMLNDKELLEKLFKFEGGAYESSYRVEETLAAYRNELKSRPAPDTAKVALQWTGSMKIGGYSRTDGLFPISYSTLSVDNEERPSRNFLIRTQLLGFYNPLHIELPSMPNVNGIEMTLTEAENFEKAMSKKSNFTNTRAYVVFDGVSFDANRNRMTAKAKLIASDLTQKYRQKKLIHTWPVAGAALGGLITEQLFDAVDFVDFMGGMQVIQDHVVAGRNTDWSRMSGAILLGGKPEVMQEDDTAISLSKSLLLPGEQRLLWQGHPPREDWRVNEFDWRDTAEKVRGAFGDAIGKRAVKAPFKVVHVRPLDLGRYDFQSSSYPMRFNRDKVVQFGYGRDDAARIVANFGNTFLPDSLEIKEDFARQLDGIMRVKKNRKFYLAIFGDVNELSSIRRSSGRGNSLYRLDIEPKVTRIALYADRAMTQLVFDFYGAEGSSLTRLQSEKKSVFEAFAIPHASYDSLLMTADRLVNDPKMLERVIRTSDQARNANELEVDDVVADIASKLQQTILPNELWLSGRLALGKYNSENGGFPVAGLGFVENSSETARLSGKFEHELINELGIVEVPRDAAKKLLKRFPKREFSFRMRVQPASASWSPRYDTDTTINMAHEAKELYVLIGDNRTKNRDKAILARLTYGNDNPVTQEPAEALIEPGDRPLLTPDLINAVVASGMGNNLSNRSLNWLVAQQWLAEKSGIESLRQRFFPDNAKRPTKATASLLRQRFKKWRAKNQISLPEKLRISFHNSNFPLYLENGANINDNLRVSQCHLTKYGYWKDLVSGLELGDLNQFENKQNEEMYRGSAEEPTVMSSVLMVFADAPFRCTSRLGERLAENFVGLEANWEPRVQILFDRLPMPPIGVADHQIIDADVSVVDMQMVDNGNDVPHVVLKVAFERAVYNSFEAGKKTPLRTITRQETEPKEAVNAEGNALDIIGVEIGMSLEEADAVLREHFGKPTILEPIFEPSLQTPTFHFARMYVSENRKERVSIFYENDGNDPQVLAVERKLDSPEWEIPRKAVFQSAIKKYGKPKLQYNLDYSTELLWGIGVGKQIDDNSYSPGTCRLSSSSERIDQWKDQSGTVHNIWEFFKSDNSYNSKIAYVPQLDFYVQPEFFRYIDQCGHFLRLEHNTFGLTVMLMDMQKYASSYLQARENMKKKFNEVSVDENEGEAEVKL